MKRKRLTPIEEEPWSSFRDDRYRKNIKTIIFIGVCAFACLLMFLGSFLHFAKESGADIFAPFIDTASDAKEIGDAVGEFAEEWENNDWEEILKEEDIPIETTTSVGDDRDD